VAADQATPSGASARTPVTLITGFLGAGKTSLVNHLLAHTKEPLAVVVNEFGDLGIDGSLVVASEEDLIELKSGCICCTLRGDLVEALERLDRRRRRLLRPTRFTRVLIECSGLATPGPVATTLLAHPGLRATFELDGTICLLHAALARQQLADHVEAEQQVALADLLLINHTDRASEHELAALEADLAVRQPFAPRVRCTAAAVAPALLFGLCAERPERWTLATNEFRGALTPGLAPQPALAAPTHGSTPDLIALQSDRPLDLAALRLWVAFLLERRGLDIWRLKAFLRCKDHSAPVVVQAVGRYLELGPGQGPAPTTSRLVAIGRGLNAAEFTRGWHALER